MTLGEFLKVVDSNELVKVIIYNPDRMNDTASGTARALRSCQYLDKLVRYIYTNGTEIVVEI